MELIILTVFTVAFALWCAADDAEEIAHGKYIRHKLQWVLRAIAVGVPCLLFGVPFFAIGLAFLFSAVFRFRLNRLRGLSVWYIGPWSSLYDRLFAALFYMRWPNWLDVLLMRDDYIEFGNVGFIHRAGRIAYAVEVVIFAAVTALVVVILPSC
jgi:hypothetical protein